MTMTQVPGASCRLLLLASIVLPIPANAQTVSRNEPAHTFRDLQSVVRPGDGIYIVEQDGKKTRGFVEGVTDSSLTLLVDGERKLFGEDRVVAVQRVHDPLKNGALIGALVGAGTLGLLTASYGPEIAGPWALVGAGIGLGAGLAIDAARWKGRVLYQKASGHVRLIPGLSRRRTALTVSYTF